MFDSWHKDKAGLMKSTQWLSKLKCKGLKAHPMTFYTCKIQANSKRIQDISENTKEEKTPAIKPLLSLKIIIWGKGRHKKVINFKAIHFILWLSLRERKNQDRNIAVC